METLHTEPKAHTTPLARLKTSQEKAEIIRLQEENQALKEQITSLTKRLIQQETDEAVKEHYSVQHEEEIAELKKEIQNLNQYYTEELTKRLEISKELYKIKNIIAIMEASRLLEI